MACKVLCPSLPDLLRKTILTFCEGSVKFDRRLEVIGSLHIRSDNRKVATFLLDEMVHRSSQGHKRVVEKTDLENDLERGEVNTDLVNLENQGGSFAVPKKSRKILKPMRRTNYNYSLESSDGESEPENGDSETSNKRDVVASRPFGILEQRRLREYADNTDSNASLSSDETYRMSQRSISTATPTNGDSRMTSPQMSHWEVTSTRPDEPIYSTPYPPPTEAPVNGDLRMEYEEQKADVQPATYQESVYPSQPPPLLDVNDNYSQDAIDLSQKKPAEENHYLIKPDTQMPALSLAPALYTGDRQIGNEELSLSTSLSTSQAVVPYTFMAQTPFISASMVYPSYTAPMTTVSTSSTVSTEQERPPRTSSTNSNDTWDKCVTCRECGRVLKSAKMLELHMNTAHTHKTVYPCKQCGKSFYAASSLHSHKKRTHTSWEQKLKCPYCPRSYAFQSELLRHIDLAHVDMGRPVTSNQAPGFLSQGFQPVMSFNMVNENHTSHSTHGTHGSHNSQQAASPASSGSGSRDEDINLHVTGMDQSEHLVTVSSQTGLRFKCTQCGMLLKSKECLALHMNAKHTQKQSYPCHICNKVRHEKNLLYCSPI